MSPLAVVKTQTSRERRRNMKLSRSLLVFDCSSSIAVNVWHMPGLGKLPLASAGALRAEELAARKHFSAWPFGW